MSAIPKKPPLNPRSFPRPPLLERTPRHLQIKWEGEIVADTREAYWVLETMHPPTYYIPPTSLTPLFAPHLRKSPHHSTICEWKGAATYWNLTKPKTSTATKSTASTNAPTTTPNTTSHNSNNTIVTNRIWSYESPTEGFAPIKGYLSFYAGLWDCYVDGERVVPQPGDFYGGWVTSEVVGVVKGGPGTWGW